MWRKIIVVFCLILGAWPALSLAQNGRSYNYDEIAAKITVEQNSTLQVEERQTFNFIGEYHTAWRVIPLNKIDSITDVSVVNSATGQPLQWVGGEREKTDPASWGKYTVTKDNGAVNIIWYYSAQDEQKTWILNYTVHGALEFRNDFDRLYWNISTDYTVPIKKVNVTILLPQNYAREQVEFTAYRSFGQSFNTTYDVNDGFTFSAGDLAAKEAFTIDAAWPRGAVDRSAYWRDWFSQHYGLIFSIIIFLVTFIAIFYLWLKREVWPEKNKTIIAEYEPPQNLRPAEMYVLLNEEFSGTTLTATVVDLAVRGYILITEDVKPGKFAKLFYGRSYDLELIKEFENDNQLSAFEKKYLSILFSEGRVLSLRKLRSSSDFKKRKLFVDIQALGKKMEEELTAKLPIYEVSPVIERRLAFIWILVFVIAVIIFSMFSEDDAWLPQFVQPILAVILAIFFWWSYYRYEARLNEQGLQLKRDILGFKLYLKTAERYRMQNLTPEIFEKFLPYAMIFGIEKKWAKNFEALRINLNEPAWYVGGAYLGSGGGADGFSASVFSASFSSSFSSAMASAAGSGVGGGGAGGGGGGGGGGAG